MGPFNGFFPRMRTMYTFRSLKKCYVNCQVSCQIQFPDVTYIITYMVPRFDVLNDFVSFAIFHVFLDPQSTQWVFIEIRQVFLREPTRRSDSPRTGILEIRARCDLTMSFSVSVADVCISLRKLGSRFSLVPQQKVNESYLSQSPSPISCDTKGCTRATVGGGAGGKPLSSVAPLAIR